MKNLENNQNGRSMIEMLGVLAIIGVLSVGGIAGYSKAMQKYRINKTIEQITIIAGNVRAFFGPQKNYIGAHCSGFYCDHNGCLGSDGGVDSSGSAINAYNGCPIIKKAKILPDEMITLDSTGTKIMKITNPFGYPANIYIESSSTAYDYKCFRITYYIRDNIEACIELMSRDWSASNVNVILLFNGSYAHFKTPVAIDKASEKCAESINNTTAEKKAQGYPYISFYFDADLNGTVWKNTSWQN